MVHYSTCGIGQLHHCDLRLDPLQKAALYTFYKILHPVASEDQGLPEFVFKKNKPIEVSYNATVF